MQHRTTRVIRRRERIATARRRPLPTSRWAPPFIRNHKHTDSHSRSSALLLFTPAHDSLDATTDLKLVKKWCENNRLVLKRFENKVYTFWSQRFLLPNSFKCNTLDCPDNTLCDCEVIEQVDCVKYLGAHVPNGTWKFMGSCQALLLLRNFFSNKLFKILYISLIHSRLNYASRELGRNWQYTKEQ